MPRPITATIHIDAMQHNLARARACAPGAKVWGVLKANGYGHGLERAMRGLAAADGLALVEPDNAVRLRELGWTGPVLLLEGPFDAADIAMMAQYGVNGAIHCDAQLALLEAARPSRPVDVHLKMNTGMNRLGFKPEAFAAAHARLRALPHVGEITLMTHFANADDAAHPRLTLHEQVRRFRAGAQGLPGPVSLSNSAGTLKTLELGDELASHWIRPGIMLYGGTPGGQTAAAFGLKPAMTLASEIISTQDIVAGDCVGYGSRFQADGAMRIGVVACGYADGYPRHAPEGTPVLVDGVRTRLVGRVSMDMLTVDLTHVPGARVGSRVVLWGEGMPIDDVAQASGTIGYELMCALAQRVRVVEG
ncbi:alanine racemase [Pseudoduganella ginsengisoli]|uniref:Alanine racemase n=1 Tax=Pseudoduganella ginsengisoli TaxID=1462440 RepID=A0A6L6Q0V0_9BURK|nr:alanine racemase [Pseudoduganella ginsengisoli]MTW03457.1 alanine racemase [Pseudoduganella ginsengisoli]